jgi:hypothetical protein
VDDAWKQCNDSWMRKIDLVEKGTYFGDVAGENPRYCFQLTRTSQEKSWVIKEVLLKPNAELETARRLRTSSGTSPALFLEGNKSLLDLTNLDPKNLNVSAVQENGEELARLAFSFPPENDVRLRGGVVFLDPSHDWILRRAELDLVLRTDSYKHLITHEYREGPGRHPITTRNLLHASGTSLGAPFEYELRSTYKLESQTSMPERDFTLSAFGLPEPFIDKPPSTRWYIWAAVAGVVCLAAGFVIRRQMRRRV